MKWMDKKTTCGLLHALPVINCVVFLSEPIFPEKIMLPAYLDKKIVINTVRQIIHT